MNSINLQLRNPTSEAVTQTSAAKNFERQSSRQSPDLVLIQQKAAALLLGSNNNNSLLESQFSHNKIQSPIGQIIKKSQHLKSNSLMGSTNLSNVLQIESLREKPGKRYNLPKLDKTGYSMNTSRTKRDSYGITGFKYIKQNNFNLSLDLGKQKYINVEESECDEEEIIMKIGKQPKKKLLERLSNKPFSPNNRLSMFSPMTHNNPNSTQNYNSGFRNIFSADEPPNRSSVNHSINKQEFSATKHSNLFSGSKLSSNIPNLDLNNINSHLNESSNIEFPKKRSDAEIRRYMAKFDEMAQSSVLQNVFIKFWKLLVKMQYKNQINIEQFKKQKGEYSPKFQSQIPTLPLKMVIYQQSLPVIIKTLGALYQTDEFVAKYPLYLNKFLFFDRFCYDLVSLLGQNVFKLNVQDIEYIFRITYLTISHFFGPQEGLKLLQNPVSPFDKYELQKLDINISSQGVNSPITSNPGVETKIKTRKVIQQPMKQVRKNRLCGPSLNNVRKMKRFGKQIVQQQQSAESNQDLIDTPDDVEKTSQYTKVNDTRNSNRNESLSNESFLEEPSKSSINIEELMKQKELLKMQQKIAKKQKIEALLLKESQARSFEPSLDQTLYDPISEENGSTLTNNSQKVIKQYKKLNQIKTKKRMNFDPNRTKNSFNMDFLEEFKNYDEAIFKKNQQNEMLQNNESLQQTEINLLQSNKIDRKTILLQHMQMYDRASCGVLNKESIDLQKESLVKKIGAIEDHQQQTPLDQYVNVSKHQGVETTKSVYPSNSNYQSQNDIFKKQTKMTVLQSVSSAQYNMGRNQKVVSEQESQETNNQRIDGIYVYLDPQGNFNIEQKILDSENSMNDTKTQEKRQKFTINLKSDEVNLDKRKNTQTNVGSSLLASKKTEMQQQDTSQTVSQNDNDEEMEQGYPQDDLIIMEETQEGQDFQLQHNSEFQDSSQKQNIESSTILPPVDTKTSSMAEEIFYTSFSQNKNNYQLMLQKHRKMKKTPMPADFIDQKIAIKENNASPAREQYLSTLKSDIHNVSASPQNLSEYIRSQEKILKNFVAQEIGEIKVQKIKLTNRMQPETQEQNTSYQNIETMITMDKKKTDQIAFLEQTQKLYNCGSLFKQGYYAQKQSQLMGKKSRQGPLNRDLPFTPKKLMIEHRPLISNQKPKKQMIQADSVTKYWQSYDSSTDPQQNLLPALDLPVASVPGIMVDKSICNSHVTISSRSDSRDDTDFRIKKSKSKHDRSKMRYQIIHKQSSQQSAGGGDQEDNLLESIQTTKLRNSTNINAIFHEEGSPTILRDEKGKAEESGTVNQASELEDEEDDIVSQQIIGLNSSVSNIRESKIRSKPSMITQKTSVRQSQSPLAMRQVRVKEVRIQCPESPCGKNFQGSALQRLKPSKRKEQQSSAGVLYSGIEIRGQSPKKIIDGIKIQKTHKVEVSFEKTIPEAQITDHSKLIWPEKDPEGGQIKDSSASVKSQIQGFQGTLSDPSLSVFDKKDQNQKSQKDQNLVFSSNHGSQNLSSVPDQQPSTESPKLGIQNVMIGHNAIFKKSVQVSNTSQMDMGPKQSLVKKHKLQKGINCSQNQGFQAKPFVTANLSMLSFHDHNLQNWRVTKK